MDNDLLATVYFTYFLGLSLSANHGVVGSNKLI